jgi:hypothetical protein
MPKMSDTTLKAILQAERNSALGGTLASDLSSERAKAMDYYNGDMLADMPSAEGRSSAVSSDVADTIEGLMPSLIEIFTAGDEAVKFEPVGPEDEDAAQQETDYVNHVFMQKNAGFMTLYTFIKDSLLQKNGIVKVYWDKSERETRETYLDQDDETFAVMASQPDVEIVEHTKHEDKETGTVTHDVTLVKRKSYGCAKAVAVPPEEFGISQFARDIKTAKYCFHEPANKTESDLIADGYDEEQVKKLPTYSSSSTTEGDSRSTVQEDQTETDAINKASRRIKTIEHYIVMDYEGDGKPGLYRVTTGGNQYEVLRRDGKPDVIPEDVMPFAAMTPVIVTHRFFGRSIADLVMDIQRIKTALIRGYLDNIYLLNNNRIEVAESHSHERTIDDLLVNRPGSIVRTKQPGGLNPIVNQPLGNVVLPAIEYFDATREWRTGVTRQGQGIDANALQNQSATAVNQAFTAAQARMKLIARIFAETGVRDMFSLLHGCIRKNDKQANTVRLRNKWVQVDPRNWKTRDDMTINVGLGDGGKAEQFMKLMKIGEVQEKLVLGGKVNLVDDQKLYTTAAEMTKIAGFKKPNDFFNDPMETGPDGQPKYPPPPPQPDPEMMKIQIQADADRKSAEHKAQIEQIQAQADIATNDRKIQADIALNERKFELEKELKMIDAQIKMAGHEMDMQKHQAGMQSQHEAHGMKMEEAKAKAQEKESPKASIEVKHGADEITGPIAQAISQFGEHVASSQEAHAKMLTDALAHMSRPKRARKLPDGSWVQEHAQ